MEFFILQNTQSGKLSLTAKEIQKWSTQTDYKVITFFISSNDRTLVDQSSEGLSFFLKTSNLFVLSSNSNVSIEHIKANIEQYGTDRLSRYQMPIITALANKQQNARVLELIHYVKKLATRGVPVKYGVVFDEADMTYPILRDQTLLMDRELVHYHSIFVQNTKHLHRVGFVTATEGCLVDAAYPECANAVLEHCTQDEFSKQNYRAIHTRDAIVHEIDCEYECHNDYAMTVIQMNKKHFFSKVKGQYRKIIINSNSQTIDMEKFASDCIAMGMNALIFNMNGIQIYGSDVCISVRNKRFNQVVYDTIETYRLDQKPIVIIGRRKVDRGLSFHYAPRDGSKGLIWTDIILGQIDDLSLAVQKAGRMAGVIAHCPQYTGECHYWATSDTLQKCIAKNHVNNSANQYAGKSIAYALLQAQNAEERFVERVTLTKEEVEAYHRGELKMERLAFYEESVERSSTNSYRLIGKVMEFYDGLQLDPRAEVPVVVEAEKEEMVEMMNNIMQRKLKIRNFIESKLSFLVDYEFEDCRQMESLAFLEESVNKMRKVGYADDKMSNTYHVLYKDNKFIVLLWNGKSLTEKPARCNYIIKKGKFKGLTCDKDAVCDKMCAKHSEEAKKFIDEDDLVDTLEDEDDLVDTLEDDLISTIED